MEKRIEMWEDKEPHRSGEPEGDRPLRSFSTFCLALSAIIICWGCQALPPPLPNPASPSTPVTLAPGDVIKISFTDEPDLNQAQKIRRDGKISLPLLGEVSAGGKRVIDFQNELIRRYSPQLENSDLVVTLETTAATVTVSGFVNKQGRYVFDRPTTVLQAIMEAGGVNDYGSLSNVHLVRIIDGEQRTEVLNLRPLVRGEPTKARYVRDGDVIYVSRSWF